MPISPDQKNAIEEVISALLTLTTSRGKRQLAAIFMDLVDRTEWPEYYEVWLFVTRLDMFLIVRKR